MIIGDTIYSSISISTLKKQLSNEDTIRNFFHSSKEEIESIKINLINKFVISGKINFEDFSQYFRISIEPQKSIVITNKISFALSDKPFSLSGNEQRVINKIKIKNKNYQIISVIATVTLVMLAIPAGILDVHPFNEVQIPNDVWDKNNSVIQHADDIQSKINTVSLGQEKFLVPHMLADNTKSPENRIGVLSDLPSFETRLKINHPSSDTNRSIQTPSSNDENTVESFDLSNVGTSSVEGVETISKTDEKKEGYQIEIERYPMHITTEKPDVHNDNIVDKKVDVINTLSSNTPFLVSWNTESKGDSDSGDPLLFSLESDSMVNTERAWPEWASTRLVEFDLYDDGEMVTLSRVLDRNTMTLFLDLNADGELSNGTEWLFDQKMNVYQILELIDTNHDGWFALDDDLWHMTMVKQGNQYYHTKDLGIVGFNWKNHVRATDDMHGNRQYSDCLYEGKYWIPKCIPVSKNHFAITSYNFDSVMLDKGGKMINSFGAVMGHLDMD